MLENPELLLQYNPLPLWQCLPVCSRPQTWTLPISSSWELELPWAPPCLGIFIPWNLKTHFVLCTDRCTFLFLRFICACVHAYVCACICVVHAHDFTCPWRSEKNIGPPETGITMVWTTRHGYWEPKPGRSSARAVSLFRVMPSFQPLVGHPFSPLFILCYRGINTAFGHACRW